MNASDIRILHRYFDGELDEAQRLRVEARLASEPELASFLRDLLRLDDSLQVAGFERAPEVLLRPPPRALLGGLLGARWLMPAWTQAVAAVLIAALAVGLLAHRGEDRAAVEQVEAAGPVSPVRLVYFSPDAGNVSVVGSFNGWRRALPLSKIEGTGYWLIEIPLEPGEYQYSFVVDGTSMVADATADFTLEDDYGFRNSVLRVGL